MDALSSHVVKFSLRHILNAGQYDFLSHFDSFGDIPGHEVVYFLGRKILWTLKSNLVLFFGMSFTALYIIYCSTRGSSSNGKCHQNRVARNVSTKISSSEISHSRNFSPVEKGKEQGIKITET